MVHVHSILPPCPTLINTTSTQCTSSLHPHTAQITCYKPYEFMPALHTATGPPRPYPISYCSTGGYGQDGRCACHRHYLKLSLFTRGPVLTPFFPGIAHSQFIKFSVPSWFFVGLATNPYKRRKTRLDWNSKPVATCTAHRSCQTLTKGWSFRHAFLSSASLPTAIPDMTLPLIRSRNESLLAPEVPGIIPRFGAQF